MRPVSVRPLAHEAIHTTVINLLKPLPTGPLLDVPAGEGALAASLIELGMDVRCCDLYPGIFGLENVEIKRADLSDSLPYEDGTFEYVTCIEGLEHIENPHQAIREFARVLKPGGRIIVSIPNILNIEERFKWLFFGYTSHFKPLSSEFLKSAVSNEFEGMQEVALHINPIAYSEVRYALENSGFSICGIHRDKPKTNSWAFLPFVWLIRAISATQSTKKQKERWSKELNSNEILLGGNTLVIEAVKLETKS